jgi:hypothetical protein
MQAPTENANTGRSQEKPPRPFAVRRQRARPGRRRSAPGHVLGQIVRLLKAVIAFEKVFLKNATIAGGHWSSTYCSTISRSIIS